MKVAAGFADGCIRRVFSSVMFLSFANVSISFELKGGPLSDSCFSGLPYASYICSRAGMTFEALEDETTLAAGKREAKSCTTTTWFEDGIGPKRSTTTYSQCLDGTLCGRIGSVVFLSANN